MEKRYSKSNKGITLVALIITIVVLLILTAVIIKEINGDGIIGKAKSGSNKFKIASIIEELELIVQGDYVENIINEKSLLECIEEEPEVDKASITEYASAIAFQYKGHLTVVDKNSLEIKCIGGNIIKSTSVADLYEDLLEEGTYILKLKKSFSNGERFWLDNTEYQKSLKTLVVDNGVEQFKATYGFIGCKSLERVYLPETFQVVNAWSFNSCSSLSEITLPSQLKTIGQSSFENCEKLENIILPNSLRSIERSAFRNSGIINIVIPEGIKVLSHAMFNYCSSLKKVILPESLEEIETAAFQFTALEIVYIPKSVKTIQDNVFNGTLGTEIYYGGNKEELAIDGYNPGIKKIYSYSETKPEVAGDYWHYVNEEITKW